MVISGFILAVIMFGNDTDPLRFYWNRVPDLSAIRARRRVPLLLDAGSATDLDWLGLPHGALVDWGSLFRLKYGLLGEG